MRTARLPAGKAEVCAYDRPSDPLEIVMPPHRQKAYLMHTVNRASLYSETAAEALRRGESFLREKGRERPRAGAEELLAWTLKIPRWRLFLDHSRALLPGEKSAYDSLLSLRADGAPPAYLLGEVGFHEIDLAVAPGVFIPRPETELLVEEARTRIARFSLSRLLDLGCGSGAIALALARVLPGLSVFASDLSPEALRLARRNAETLGLSGRIEFREGDLFSPWRETGRSFFDVIACNPPYIRREEIPGLPGEVSLHEPLLALDGGEDGLAVIERLTRESPAYLRPGGWLIFEIGADQGESAPDLCRANPEFEDVSLRKDYAGKDRVVSARKKAD